MNKPKDRFRVAEIALDADGIYHLAWLGEHADQGGLSYRWGSIGISGIDGLGAIIEKVLGHVKERQLEQVKTKYAEIQAKEAQNQGPVRTGNGSSTPEGA